jgi:hypothetical protein
MNFATKTAIHEGSLLTHSYPLLELNKLPLWKRRHNQEKISTIKINANACKERLFRSFPLFHVIISIVLFTEIHTYL